MTIYMYEFPVSFGFRFAGVDAYGHTPDRQPWLYLASPDHPWFDHHERGHNRTMKFNCAPTIDY